MALGASSGGGGKRSWMETNDLIEALAAELRPVRRRRVEWLVIAGMGFALLAALAVLGLWLGIRPDLLRNPLMPTLWCKLIYACALATAAGALACRLARPAAKTSDLWALATAPLLITVAWGANDLASASEAVRWRLLLGRTWAECPVRIVVLALPGLAVLLSVLRRQAPTELHQAGFAVGLTAGALAAGAYSLHCREDSVPFLAVWYTLGVLSVAGLGWLLGPRWLRW